ncbi:hypothetical protein [Geobacter sp.]|uniref:hypothetical protein n=1 Tax=Geobacter sp. TaxID=46610 RepID=UPI0027B9C990|nr:hypothetical protein [Geobacter sp.]
MWREFRFRIATLVVGTCVLAFSPGGAQDTKPAPADDDIAHHERMLTERTTQTERARAAMAKTAGEIREVQEKLGQEQDPTVRRHLQLSLEKLRVRLLRQTILQRRAELKQQEVAEHIAILREGKKLPPDESRRKRFEALSRRLERAEGLMELITEYQESAISDREKKRISQLLEDQRRVIADIREAIEDLEGKDDPTGQQ